MPSRPLYDPILRFIDLVLDKRIIVENRGSSAIEPMVPTPGQEGLLAIMLEQARNGLPIEIDTPKARKQGISTLVQAIFVVLCDLIPGRYSLTYAHTDAAAKNIFRIGQRIYTHLTGRKVDSAYKIEYPNGSIYECCTFRGLGSGRGGTPHGIHLSELAAAVGPNDQDAAAVAGLINALPDAPHTMLVNESTGNGPFGAFYDRCMKAKDPQSGSRSKLYFLPWFRDPEYTEEPPHNFVLTESETKRASRFKLSNDQLAWYRMKRAKQPGDQYMRKEFPETFEDCFAAAQGLVYPTFSSQAVTEGGNVGELEITNDWQRARSIDWGFSQYDPFVCLWIAHLPGGRPKLVVHPDCRPLIKEFALYARDEKTGKPVDDHNHGLDCLRMAVIQGRFTGTVYVYRCVYIKPCLSPSDAAAQVLEGSGWAAPDKDRENFGKWTQGKEAEQYKFTVADRSQPGTIAQFRKWRISPIEGQKTPVERALIKSAESRGEIEDGVAIVLSLISGDANFFATFEPLADRAQRKVDEARSLVGNREFRPRLTEAENKALKDRFKVETNARTKDVWDIAI